MCVLIGELIAPTRLSPAPVAGRQDRWVESVSRALHSVGRVGVDRDAVMQLFWFDVAILSQLHAARVLQPVWEA
jgi:hypothetical protein